MKKNIFIALLAGALCASSVSASAFYKLDYDLENGRVTVKGNTEKAYSNVTLEILKAGKTAADLENLSEENAHNVIIQYDQCVADENGDYVFEFKLADSVLSGEYVTLVTYNKKVDENKLSYIAASDFANALLAVNNSANDTEMLAAIDAGLKNLGVDNPYYSKLTPEEKTAVAKAVYDGKKDGAYSYDFVNVFNKVMAVEAVNHSGDDNVDVIEVLEYYDDIFKISELGSYPTFSGQTDDVKTKIADIIEAGRYESVDAVRNAFEDATVRCALYYASGYDKVYKILSDNNHILNINFTAYNSLTAKSEVDKKMISSMFESAAAITTAFNQYVAASQSYYPSNNGGGGGSSSGGGSKGSSSISMPTVGTQTVNVNKTETKVNFNDIENVAWAKQSIERLAEDGIVSGKGNNAYAPMDAVKREEFVTMLVKALKLDNGGAKCDFADVDNSDWYYNYVASGVSAGLVSGISLTDFGAGMNISKQDIATLLWRAAEMKGIEIKSDDVLGQFEDEAEISDYAKAAVEALCTQKIINGNGSGKFEPKKSATRAETAVMLDRFLELL